MLTIANKCNDERRREKTEILLNLLPWDTGESNACGNMHPTRVQPKNLHIQPLGLDGECQFVSSIIFLRRLTSAGVTSSCSRRFTTSNSGELLKKRLSR